MSPVLSHGADTTIWEGYLTKGFATCSNKGEMRGMCWSMGQILSHGDETWYFSGKSSLAGVTQDKGDTHHGVTVE